jgi:rod shape determining protein RodA
MRLEDARDSLRNFDYLMFGAVAALVAIGIAFIDSASVNSGAWGELTQRGHFPEQQFQWSLISVGVFFAILVPRYSRLKGLAFPLYILALGLLVYVLYKGVGPARSPGVRRWIPLPSASFRKADLQPSQIAEVAVVLVLARYLLYHQAPKIRHIVVVFLLCGIPMLLVLRQPDLGTALLFIPLPLVLLFVSGARLKHLFVIIAGGLAAIPFLWAHMLDYQKMRFMAWLEPEIYIKNEGWQYICSRIAVGSGGLFGKGLGHGTQNSLNYLPESHTDFIFSVLLEEWGFVGGLLVMFLYLIIIFCGLGIAARTRDPFGRLLVVGAVTLLATQVFVNMGMNIGLMPITGLTLPFISYGGSSLLASFTAVAIMMNVAVHPVIVLSRDEM